MKNYFKNWNFTRVLRLVLGVFIVVQGVMVSEWMFVVLGVLFSLMPLFNIGCCGTSGCNIPASKSNKKTENITYDELH